MSQYEIKSFEVNGFQYGIDPSPGWFLDESIYRGEVKDENGHRYAELIDPTGRIMTIYYREFVLLAPDPDQETETLITLDEKTMKLLFTKIEKG